MDITSSILYTSGKSKEVYTNTGNTVYILFFILLYYRLYLFLQVVNKFKKLDSFLVYKEGWKLNFSFEEVRLIAVSTIMLSSWPSYN